MTGNRASRRTWCWALLLAALIVASSAPVGASAPAQGPSDPAQATRDAIIGEARESQAKLRALAEAGEIDAARQGGRPYARRLMKDRRVLDRVIRFARSRTGILRGLNTKGKVTGGTAAAARLNVPGVKTTLFVEGSPNTKPANARSNNPRYPSAQKHGATQNHAEQNVAGSMGDAVAAVHGSGSSVTGRVHIHVEVPPCSSCRQGAKNAKAAAGPLAQFSAEFRNLVVVITNARNSEVIVLRGGREVARFSAADKKAGVFVSPGTDQASTGPALDPALGGVDFSSLELRYLSDVSSDKTKAAGFAFKARPTRAGSHGRAGWRAAQRASDAFFVWLALPPSAMWVNLNPSEPERIIEPRFGRTTAGRVLLEADLRMKKTAARLTNPNTRLGRRYWNELDAITGGRVACSASRMWIVPAPATVRETADELYIVKAPLRVKLESDLFADLGAQCGGLPVYVKETEAIFRRLILPRVQRAVRSAPQYAALRSVYMSRVAAEWYRKRADHEHGAFADIIGSGDISRWAPKRSWTPRQTFRRYVRSYKNGEYKVKRRTRKGNYVYTYTYQDGGVDFAVVPRQNVSASDLQTMRPGLPGRISQALMRATADPQTHEVWLGGGSFDRAAAAEDPVFTGEDPAGGLARVALLLVLCFLIVAAAAWSIVRVRAKAAPRAS